MPTLVFFDLAREDTFTFAWQKFAYKIWALPGPGAALVPLRGREGEDAAFELVSPVLEWELATEKEVNLCSHI